MWKRILAHDLRCHKRYRTIDQLAMANGVRQYGHVLKNDDHVTKRVLDFEVKDQRKRGGTGQRRSWLRKKV